jgi:uncharacterized protein YceK
MIALRLALLSLIFLSGCGNVMMSYYKGVSTAAIAATACRDVLTEANDGKTKAVADKAKTDAAGAQADLNAWLPVYEKVKTACVSLKVGSKLALNAAPTVEAAVTKQKDAMAWIARLAKLGFDAAATLAEAGLKLPGGP